MANTAPLTCKLIGCVIRNEARPRCRLGTILKSEIIPPVLANPNLSIPHILPFILPTGVFQPSIQFLFIIYLPYSSSPPFQGANGFAILFSFDFSVCIYALLFPVTRQVLNRRENHEKQIIKRIPSIISSCIHVDSSCDRCFLFYFPGRSFHEIMSSVEQTS